VVNITLGFVDVCARALDSDARETSLLKRVVDQAKIKTRLLEKRGDGGEMRGALMVSKWILIY